METKNDHNLVEELTETFLSPKAHAVTVSRLKQWDQPPSLASAIDIDETRLSPTARSVIQAIESLETDGGDEVATTWRDFLWKLAAFQCIQDIFDCPIHSGKDDPRHLFEQYYFYYESRRLLAESILCGLNGFPAAADALLRPFLEFTMLQHYYVHQTRQAGSYEPLARYFRTQRHPSWNTVMRTALPKDEFSKPIARRVLAHLRALSENAIHPYHPNTASSQYKTTPAGLSFEGIHFWYSTAMIVDAVLWTYYTRYPLLFFPVDFTRKFGFNGPVGLVIDHDNAKVIRKSLVEEDYQRFLASAKSREEVASIRNWIASQPDLTDAEIIGTWDEKEAGAFPGIEIGQDMRNAKLRALRVATAIPRRTNEGEELPSFFRKAMRTYEGWVRLGHITSGKALDKKRR